MKNANISNINTLGKIFNIITIIAKVAVIIAFVFMLIIGTAALFIPSDAVKINADCNASIAIEDNGVTDKLVEVDEDDINWDIFGMNLKWKVEDSTDDNGDRLITINGAAENISARELKIAASLCCFGLAVLCAAVFIALIFGGRLAKTLAKCESPFSDEVIRAMGTFGKSLIPIGVIAVLCGGAGIGVLMLVLLVLLFIHIIKYGAELQKDVDETV